MTVSLSCPVSVPVFPDTWLDTVTSLPNRHRLTHRHTIWEWRCTRSEAKARQLRHYHDRPRAQFFGRHHQTRPRNHWTNSCAQLESNAHQDRWCPPGAWPYPLSGLWNPRPPHYQTEERCPDPRHLVRRMAHLHAETTALIHTASTRIVGLTVAVASAESQGATLRDTAVRQPRLRSQNSPELQFPPRLSAGHLPSSSLGPTKKFFLRLCFNRSSAVFSTSFNFSSLIKDLLLLDLSLIVTFVFLLQILIPQ